MSTDVQTVDTGLDKQSRRRSKDTEKAHRRSSNFQNKRYKHDHKFRKKTAANGKFPPYKKRNKDFIIPPTKFLLGGNITDPLNLNSLQDEDINRAMNAVTPKSSPLPTPKHRKGEIEVIIPPDITDPLNLIACDDDATYEAMLTSPVKKTAKKQKKYKKRRSHRTSSGPGSGKEDTIEGAKLDQVDPSPLKEENKESQEESIKEAKPEEETKEVKDTPPGPPPAKRHKSDHNNRANLRKIELKERKADLDKIVSPVIPQPGTWNDRHRFRPPPQRTPQIDKSQAKKLPKFKESNAKFQYGNYCRYYGYRNPNHGSDVRFRVFEKHKHLFEGKDVLDIGCNAGHLTLAIARDFHPNRVVGMDIDRSLIAAARSNIRHYVNCGKEDKFFPVSMPIVYGPIEIPGVNEEKGFPHNISFVQGNYVLESDVLLSLEQPQFDVILCLSITKWIQLNWGDTGLKRAFKRMFAQLRPGGVLILEAQCWSSYKRKRNLTPETWKNYHAVELFPHHFTQYLLNEVGFSKCEVIGAPLHQSRGFQRPIKMFIKEDPSFDTPRPIGYNTERFESYSFRLPESVHCPDDFSGDSNFPYETPNSFNSPESGFSEGLHPRRYPVMRLGLPLDEADGGGDGAGTSGEWRPKSAGEVSQLDGLSPVPESTDSGSQGTTEETTTSPDSEQEELRGTSGNLEVMETEESRPIENESEKSIEKAETSEHPITKQMEKEEEISDTGKVDKNEESDTEANKVLQKLPTDREGSDTESQETKELIDITTKEDKESGSNTPVTGVDPMDSQ